MATKGLSIDQCQMAVLTRSEGRSIFSKIWPFTDKASHEESTHMVGLNEAVPDSAAANERFLGALQDGGIWLS